jgi:ribosomal protein S18 acetylase RimI-like enzyme
MTEDVAIRSLTINDLISVAAIHRTAFPDSALTKLGLEAVRRYYEWLLVGPHEAANLAAVVDGKVAGFCFGGVFRGAMSGFLNKHQVFLFSRVLRRPWIAANPIFFERFISGLRILRRAGKPKKLGVEQGRPAARPFGILAIAVHPAYQGLGVGKLLMQESELVARRRGFLDMVLTVNTGNHQAIRFYEGLGWKRINERGEWEGGMRKPLGTATAGANASISSCSTAI